MLDKEKAVGDYTSEQSATWMTKDKRQEMVVLIEEIHKEKDYKIDTFFLAVTLADRHLLNVIRQGCTRKQSPCLATLAVACLLLAAKLE